jgi:hypothetical protein
MVYYHFDANHQALWHLRTSKRIWLYPACDERFASRDIMEEIFAGTYDHDEEIPYSPEFDEHAVVYRLDPGDVVSWPQNAPHRIENLDTLDVSFSTGFVTDAADRRHLTYSANHLLRRRFGLPTVSTRETGLAASAKCAAYRLFPRARWLPKGKGAARNYPKDLRVAPVAPLGFSPGDPLSATRLFQQPGRGVSEQGVVACPVGREAGEAETQIHSRGLR